ncbi:PIN domain-containing protein [Candidatus Pacearchaeota archaeon]|nr:PIN domain-containing protein [Candidatus Pacearchaeota archaeon]
MLLDTSAIISYLEGTLQGDKVKNYLSEEQCYVSSISLGEVAAWCTKSNLPLSDIIARIRGMVKVLHIKEETLINAGVFTVERKKEMHNWGIMDSCIYLTAQEYGFTVVTLDHHFKGLEGVEVIE